MGKIILIGKDGKEEREVEKYIRALRLVTAGALATKHIEPPKDIPRFKAGKKAETKEFKAFCRGVIAMDRWWRELCALTMGSLEQEVPIPDPHTVLDLPGVPPGTEPS